MLGLAWTKKLFAHLLLANVRLRCKRLSHESQWTFLPRHCRIGYLTCAFEFKLFLEKILWCQHFNQYPACYLQDLFTDPAVRGRVVGRALIEGVYQAAKASGVKRVYWQTHETNTAGRALYDKVAQHAGFIIYGNDA